MRRSTFTGQGSCLGITVPFDGMVNLGDLPDDNGGPGGNRFDCAADVSIVSAAPLVVPAYGNAWSDDAGCDGIVLGTYVQVLLEDGTCLGP